MGVEGTKPGDNNTSKGEGEGGGGHITEADERTG